MAHSVATPALLCHKEPAQGIQSPLLGALGRNAPSRGISCLSLVLYGIRIGGFHAGKGSPIGQPYATTAWIYIPLAMSAGEGSVITSTVPHVRLWLSTGVGVGGALLTVIPDHDVIPVSVENGLVSTVAVSTLNRTITQGKQVLSPLAFIRKYM